MIHARGVSFRYPSGRSALDGIDLDIEAGDFVAIIGPNGSGKSTLLRLLGGLFGPSAGTISFGSDRDRPDPATLGWAADSAVHFDELTGRQNAGFFVRAYGPDTSGIDRLMAAFGLAEHAGAPVAEYSFGMRRKLMLVQALAHSPRLVLMDEPTVGLDPDALAALQAEIRSRAGAGAAVIIATNDLGAASEAARVVFLDRGRKVADDSPARLLASLDGRTQADIVLDSPPVTLPAAGTAIITRTATGLAATLDRGAADLPEILRLLLEAGATPREIRVREPGLADVFRAMTGTDVAALHPGRDAIDPRTIAGPLQARGSPSGGP